MSTEHHDRDAAETFRQSYKRLVDRAPVSDPEWPPVLTAQVTTSRPAPRGWMVAAMAFFITLAFGLGGLVAPGRPSADSEPFQVQTETTKAAVPETSGAFYPTPADAAIAYTEAQEPQVEDPQVTRIIAIYADQDIVDLRVKVEASGFCHWYGVTGRVDQNELAWRGGPAQSCE